MNQILDAFISFHRLQRYDQLCCRYLGADVPIGSHLCLPRGRHASQDPDIYLYTSCNNHIASIARDTFILLSVTYPKHSRNYYALFTQQLGWGAFSPGSPKVRRAWTCWRGPEEGREDDQRAGALLWRQAESWGCLAWRREGSGDTF